MGGFDKLPLEIAPVFAAAKTEDGARIFSSELLLFLCHHSCLSRRDDFDEGERQPALSGRGGDLPPYC